MVSFSVIHLIASSNLNLNVAPVIGVLYQPIDSSLSPLCPSCSSYIVSSYVQWLQGAGARVALLDWNSTDTVLAQGFEQVRAFALATAALAAEARARVRNSHHYPISHAVFLPSARSSPALS